MGTRDDEYDYLFKGQYFIMYQNKNRRVLFFFIINENSKFPDDCG